MDNFSKTLSFDSKNIPGMSYPEKHELMDEIEKRKSLSIKYSFVFLLFVLFYVFARAMYNMLVLFRDSEILSFVNSTVVIAPLVILILSLFACSISKPFMAVTLIAFAAFGVYSIINGDWFVALLSFFGAYVYYWFMEVCDAYKALSNEKGFPDFYELSRDMVNKSAVSSTNSDENS